MEKKERSHLANDALALFLCMFPLGTVLETNKNGTTFDRRGNYTINVSVAWFNSIGAKNMNFTIIGFQNMC